MGAKFDASEEASFEIAVDLQRETMLEEETFMNSAASVVSSKGVIAHVMVLAWSYAMWQTSFVPCPLSVEVPESDIDIKRNGTISLQVCLVSLLGEIPRMLSFLYDASEPYRF